MADLTNIAPNLHNSVVDEWQTETIEMLIEQGYRAVPVYPNGKTAPYKDGQTYPPTDSKWTGSNPDIICAILDRAVLVDYDGNKPDGAIPLAELQLILGTDDLDKHLVQENDKGDSLHYLFKLPDELDMEDIKASNDGWLHGVDVKTKNQPIHIKRHKTLNDDELPKLDELDVVPSVVLDALLNVQPDCDLSAVEKWDGKTPEINEAKKILSYIDSDCTYKEWSTVFAGVTMKFGNSQEAIELLDEWSSKGSKYTSLKDIAYKVSSYSHTGARLVTFSSVCQIAEKYGANLAKIAKEKEQEELAEEYPTLESCFECLADESREDAHETAYTAAISYIHAITNSLSQSRAIKKLKSISGVTQGDIKGSLKAQDKSEEDDPLTHLEMATQWAQPHTKKGLVAEYGKLWRYDETKGIWKDKELNKVAISIAEKFNKESRCARESDYKSIANVAYNLNHEADFFLNAPSGVNTPKGFICIENGQLELVKPNKDHRCTFRLSVSPSDTDTPMFDKLLSDAFGETLEEQRELLMQLIGCSILGLIPSLQIAVFLLGVGGSGKSTVLKIIEALIPSDSRCAVKPEDFGHEYHRAALAGKRFNLVPEINKDKPIPSADFKAIISGDSVSARETFGKVFTMKPNAANWFNGNFFMTTRDRSSAFWRRWKIVHFIHAKTASERITDLDKKIIESELAGVLYKSLEAAQRFLQSGTLAESSEHDRMMLEWSNSSNSVLLWLNDSDSRVDTFELGCQRLALRPSRSPKSTEPLTVREAYIHYKAYCAENGRKPFNKKEFVSYVEEAGHPVTSYNGLATFKSLTFYDRLSVSQHEALKYHDKNIANMF
ncbi:phage/plasmid primase, P4 family [Vibrio rumoiensis]|uniref:Phage/plasmid primase, P4 family n=1 Tax=Vibrio rumoiensis TaxID=76258 RepID=A0ABW7J0E4_9VIBR